jgi:hypothetical protein
VSHFPRLAAARSRSGRLSAPSPPQPSPEQRAADAQAWNGTSAPLHGRIVAERLAGERIAIAEARHAPVANDSIDPSRGDDPSRARSAGT